MLPNEAYILKRINTDRKWPDELAGAYDIPGIYIGYLIDSYIKRGLIKRNWSGGYMLSAVGKNRLLST
ncbi:MAG: hypothetical protein WC370_07805 [Dehalococcoidales bacterium]|jgi:hypothetical protein